MSSTPYLPELVEQKMNNIKRQHRPQFEDLEDWQHNNYAETFPEIAKEQLKWLEYLDVLHNGKLHPQAETDCTEALNAYNAPTPANAIITQANINDLPLNKQIIEQKFIQAVERRDHEELSVEEFREKYEFASKPVLITGCIENWASKGWTLEDFAKTKWNKARFRLGDDDDDRAIREPFDMYMQYLQTQKDDSPLYLFEDDFGERPESADMTETYSPPKYFSEDLFLLLPVERRPPFRWVIMGPERAGTKVHQDPLGTSAWNVITSGIKRWVMFSPKLTAALANGSFLYTQEEKDLERSLEAIEYFTQVIPRIRKWIAGLPAKKREEYQMIECLQYPNELIYVPGGWHHAVMNMKPAFSYTQNWASVNNFYPIWEFLVVRRRNLARRLFDRIAVLYPDLAKSVVEKAKADKKNVNFLMEPQNDPKMKPRRVRIYDSIEKEQKYLKRQEEFIKQLIPDFDEKYPPEQREEVYKTLLQGNVCSSDSDDAEEETTEEEEESSDDDEQDYE